VSKKSPQIAALIADCAGDPKYDAHYLGYFKCFNAQLYYEAHDVLEELWLADKHGPRGNFYKGLIQFTGAFVHLQKERLGPAGKLFQLALNNWAPYPAVQDDLELSTVQLLANTHLRALEQSQFTVNPWSPQTAPHLAFEATDARSK
jgi:predicted metal-dependent hydrolase